MTELLTTTRLREIAHVTEHPHMYSGRLIPRLTWTVDTQTGRPIAHWTTNDPDGVPSARI
jgi:hypothetical protein